MRRKWKGNKGLRLASLLSMVPKPKVVGRLENDKDALQAMWRAFRVLFSFCLGLLLSSQAFAANVTITVDWPEWTEENSLQIYDATNTTALTPVFTSSSADYPVVSYTLPDDTAYTLRMMDTYGDGWNGDSLVVIEVDGKFVQSGLLVWGTSDTLKFTAAAPRTYTPPSFAGSCSKEPVATDIISGLDAGKIQLTNTLNGGSGLTTTTPYVAGIVNAIASNADNKLVYYGNDSTLYYWDVKAGNDAGSHHVLADLASFPEFLGGNLHSGGAGYFNGVLYVGSEQNGGGLEDVFAVTLSADGKSVESVEALGVKNAAAAADYYFRIVDNYTDTFGDLVVTGEGAAGRIYGSTNSLWSYDLATRDFTVIADSDTWTFGQLAVDVNGVVYTNIGATLYQLDLNDGSTIGSGVSLTASPADLSGPSSISQCASRDYSDLPADGGTAPDGESSIGYGQAAHVVKSGIQLGAVISDETTAVKDADNASDDGIITFPALRAGDTDYTIPAAYIDASGSGTLYAWLDFDGDGKFEANEFAYTTVTAGSADDALNWAEQNTMGEGTTYARFRLSSDSLTSADAATLASDGEVEDYAVTIEAELPPQQLACDLESLDFSGINTNSPAVGSLFTDRLLTQANTTFPNATYSLAITEVTGPNGGIFADIRGNNKGDFALTRDKNGAMAAKLSFSEPVDFGVSEHESMSGNTHITDQWTLTINAGGSFTVEDPGKQDLAIVSQSATSITFDLIRGDNDWEIIYADVTEVDARFVSSSNDNTSILSFETCLPVHDYSDAPADGGVAPDGTSVTAYGVAGHTIISGIQLGAAIDADEASIASADASGDGADDDGIAVFPTLTEGDTSYTIPAANISASGTGNLYAWIDFDGNGKFDGTEFTSTTVTAGTVNTDLNFSGFTAPSAGMTSFVRLRLTTDTLSSADAAGATNGGEVEDYTLTVEAAAPTGYAVTGRVYNDSNVDGSNDPDETGLSRLPVVLMGSTAAGDPVCISSYTDANGEYRFAGVAAGSYQLYEAPSETVPSPASCDPANAGDPSGYVSSTANVHTAITLVDADISGIDFGDLRLPTFSPDNSASIQPGSTTHYAHRFTPRSSGTVSFGGSHSTPASEGWSSVLYQDLDCNGELNASEAAAPVAASLSTSADIDLCLINRVQAPTNVEGGESWTNQLTASFDTGNSIAGGATLQVSDRTTITSAAPQGGTARLVLKKTVQNLTQGTAETDTQNQAKPNDRIRYRIYYSNTGNAPLTELVINDAVPDFTSLHAAPVCEQPLPATMSACTPSVAGRAIKWVFTAADALQPGEKGVVSYEVSIDD